MKTLGAIDCVRWNSAGDRLATASRYKTISVLDFASGKIYYTGSMPDRRKNNFFVINSVLISSNRSSYFSLFHLSKAIEETNTIISDQLIL